MYRRSGNFLRCLLILVLACWAVSGLAQVVPLEGGMTGDTCPPWPWNSGCGFDAGATERFILVFGRTIGPVSGMSNLLVAIKLDETSPTIDRPPYGLIVTGNGTAQPAPPGIPPYNRPGYPNVSWFHGSPVFSEVPDASAAFTLRDPNPGNGTWRAFSIPLNPQGLPVSAGPNVGFFFLFGTDRHANWDDVIETTRSWASASVLTGAGKGFSDVKADTLFSFGDFDYLDDQYDDKMHFHQNPDTNGIDIDFTHPKVLADDWLCTGSGPVNAISFWFSAKADWFDTSMLSDITNIHVSIHADIPDPDGEGPLFSMPGDELWARDFGSRDPTVRIELCATGLQSWYDPATPEYTASDHLKMFRCNIENIINPFEQEELTIYWLSLSLTTNDPGDETMLLGWKTAYLDAYPPGYAGSHFVDDAVWGEFPAPMVWDDLTFPAQPDSGESLDLAFIISEDSTQICHDGRWDHAEDCAYDALLATGVAEMNHSCIVDYVDATLMKTQYLMSGPNLSGDLNGDGSIDLSDMSLFAAGYGLSVSPCTPDTVVADGCVGTIAVSFSTDPSAIVSTQVQIPGMMNTAYVIIDGWTDAMAVEYSIETSSNVMIMNHDTAYPNWSGPMGCDPDAQHSYRNFGVGTAAEALTGPTMLAQINYLLLDADPAWITLTPVGCNASHLRWADNLVAGNYDFDVVLNAGINGPDPAGSSTCGPPGAVGDDLPRAVYGLRSYPNPFNPNTNIQFMLPGSQRVRLCIFSVDGRRVTTLVDEIMSAGTQEVQWNARDSEGRMMPSGTYFYRLQAGEYVETKRMTLLK